MKPTSHRSPNQITRDSGCADQRKQAAVTPSSRDLAALLALSDERDQWQRRLIAAERAAYLMGYEDGRADERRDVDRAWAATPVRRVSTGPTFAELELLRYGPGGREHFGDPRPGDRFPRAEAA